MRETLMRLLCLLLVSWFAPWAIAQAPKGFTNRIGMKLVLIPSGTFTTCMEMSGSGVGTDMANTPMNQLQILKDRTRVCVEFSEVGVTCSGSRISAGQPLDLVQNQLTVERILAFVLRWIYLKVQRCQRDRLSNEDAFRVCIDYLRISPPPRI